MSSPRHSIQTMGGARSGSPAAGFTGVELLLGLLVVLLAGLLACIVLGRMRQQQDAGRFIADLQGFATAFQSYHRQSHVWPASTNREGRLPPELEAVLEDTNWAGGSPYGGRYGWVSPGAVVLTAYAPDFPLRLTRAELLEIDRQMDDGDLHTGRLRTGFNGWPVYFVGEKP